MALLWVCGSVALCLCGSVVGLWLCCGSVALWHIQPDAVEELTNPLERIGEGLLSPFDDRLMYNADGEVVVLDLVSGQREVIYSGSNTGAVDWLPVARPILETP